MRVLHGILLSLGSLFWLFVLSNYLEETGCLGLVAEVIERCCSCHRCKVAMHQFDFLSPANNTVTSSSIQY